MNQINQSDIRNRNLKSIYDAVSCGEDATRAAMAKRLSLSRTAISSLVDELIADGLIIEVGKRGRTSGVGRIPIQLSVAAGKKYIVSVLWKKGEAEGVLIDIGEPDKWKKEEKNSVIFPVHSADQYVPSTYSCFCHFKTVLKDADILGCTVIVPGIMDSRKKNLLAIPLGISSEKGEELVRGLEEIFREENLVLENDTAVMAYAELKKEKLYKKNFMYVNFADGIGAVFYLYGKPFGNATGRNTSFGYITVNEGSRKGNLESLIGKNAVENKWRHLLAGRKLPGVDKGCAPNIYSQLQALSEEGNAEAVKAMDEIKDDFSRALAMTCTIMYPEKVIIGGYGSCFSRQSLDGIYQRLQGLSLKYIMKDIDLTASKISGRDIFRGAAEYAFDTHFNFVRNSLDGFHIG